MLMWSTEPSCGHFSLTHYSDEFQFHPVCGPVTFSPWPSFIFFLSWVRFFFFFWQYRTPAVDHRQAITRGSLCIWRFTLKVCCWHRPTGKHLASVQDKQWVSDVAKKQLYFNDHTQRCTHANTLSSPGMCTRVNAQPQMLFHIQSISAVQLNFN